MRGTFAGVIFSGTDLSGQPLPPREINLVAQTSKLMSPVVIERSNGGEDTCDGKLSASNRSINFADLFFFSGRFTDVFPECFDDVFSGQH